MTVVVHSFVADSTLLDRLLWFGGVLLSLFFPTLCLQVGNRLGFWGGFSCFISFIWCQLFACLSRAHRPACFTRLLFHLYGPSAETASCCSLNTSLSFFVCHQHLWYGLSFFATVICVQSLSFMAFSAVGIRVRLFCLCLVSACFRVSVYLSISVWYHAVRLLLVSFILGDSNLNLFQASYPVDSPTNSALKQTPFGIPP